MADDVLAPCILRPSAAMILTQQDKKVMLFHMERYWLPVPSRHWEMRENINIFLPFLNKLTMARVNILPAIYPHSLRSAVNVSVSWPGIGTKNVWNCALPEPNETSADLDFINNCDSISLNVRPNDLFKNLSGIIEMEKCPDWAWLEWVLSENLCANTILMSCLLGSVLYAAFVLLRRHPLPFYIWLLVLYWYEKNIATTQMSFLVWKLFYWNQISRKNKCSLGPNQQ